MPDRSNRLRGIGDGVIPRAKIGAILAPTVLDDPISAARSVLAGEIVVKSDDNHLMAASIAAWVGVKIVVRLHVDRHRPIRFQAGLDIAVIRPLGNRGVIGRAPKDAVFPTGGQPRIAGPAIGVTGLSQSAEWTEISDSKTTPWLTK